MVPNPKIVVGGGTACSVAASDDSRARLQSSWHLRSPTLRRAHVAVSAGGAVVKDHPAEALALYRFAVRDKV